MLLFFLVQDLARLSWTNIIYKCYDQCKNKGEKDIFSKEDKRCSRLPDYLKADALEAPHSSCSPADSGTKD